MTSRPNIKTVKKTLSAGHGPLPEYRDGTKAIFHYEALKPLVDVTVEGFPDSRFAFSRWVSRHHVISALWFMKNLSWWSYVQAFLFLYLWCAFRDSFGKKLRFLSLILLKSYRDLYKLVDSTRKPYPDGYGKPLELVFGKKFQLPVFETCLRSMHIDEVGNFVFEEWRGCNLKSINFLQIRLMRQIITVVLYYLRTNG